MEEGRQKRIVEPKKVFVDLDDALEYIRLLEKNLKRLHTKVRQLEEDNSELRRKCKEHFTAAQNLMRYELKIPERYEEAQRERVVKGVLANGESFTIGPSPFSELQHTPAKKDGQAGTLTIQE